MLARKISDFTAYLFVRVLVCIAQAIRIETGQRVAEFLAWLLYDVLHVRRKVVMDNLEHAFPELSPKEREKIARDMWRHLFLLALEVAHTPRKIHETNWRSFVHIENKAEVVRALLEDRPTMIVTAHFGNFEVGGYVLGVLGFPTHTIARTLDNPYIDKFVNEFRGKTGQFIIPKNGGFGMIEEVLSSNGTLTVLSDQHAGRKGYGATFFNRKASTHKAIALLSLDHDTPIIMCAVRRVGRPLQFQIEIGPVADPRSLDEELHTVSGLTQWFTNCLEESIRRSPDQYWWVHRRWKEVRPRKRHKKAA